MTPDPGLVAKAGAKLGIVPLALASLLSLLSESAFAQPTDPTAAGASFVDRFATLDHKRWFASNGWSNGTWQNCTWSAKNVKVTGASIELSLTNEPGKDRPFTCGEVQSQGFYGYGTFEVRMRPVPASGVISAFFSYTGPPHGGDRPHDEIDFEFLGKNTGRAELAYFGKGVSRGLVYDLGFDPTRSMNDYAFQWTPDALRWFVNRKLAREVLRKEGEPFPTHPAKIIISIWTGAGSDQEAWQGRFDYPGHPVVAAYEYVAFTELGKACQFPTSVVCGQAPAGSR